MTTTVDALRLRRIMGRHEWSVPDRFGPDGWALTHKGDDGQIIVTAAEWDGVEWVHASMTRRDRVPSYEDLCRLHQAAFRAGGFAYHVFAPPSEHINIHEYALHLWGRADGAPALPDFGMGGTI